MSEPAQAFPVRVKDGVLGAELPPGEIPSDYIFLVPSIEQRNMFDLDSPQIAVKKNGKGLAREMDQWVESI